MTAVHNDPIFAIGGRPKVGKTTTRKLLAQYTEFLGGSCSDVVYSFFAERIGKTIEECRAMDKEQIRPELVRLGNQLCETDPAYLVRALYESGVRVIDGVRRRAEWEAVCQQFPVVSVWVENPRVPHIEDNTELTQADFQYTLNNVGTLKDLADGVRAFGDATLSRWMKPT